MTVDLRAPAISQSTQRAFLTPDGDGHSDTLAMSWSSPERISGIVRVRDRTERSSAHGRSHRARASAHVGRPATRGGRRGWSVHVRGRRAGLAGNRSVVRRRSSSIAPSDPSPGARPRSTHVPASGAARRSSSPARRHHRRHLSRDHARQAGLDGHLGERRDPRIHVERPDVERRTRAPARIASSSMRRAGSARPGIRARSWSSRTERVRRPGRPVSLALMEDDRARGGDVGRPADLRRGR